MAKTTTNFSLHQPELSDFYDIELFNANMGIIDKLMVGNIIKKLTSSDDLNKIVKSGFYMWFSNDAPANAPTEGVNMNYMRVWNGHETSNCCQEIVAMSVGGSNTNCMLRRNINSSNASPWEWVNPPMRLNVEYRTTERYEDEAVYVKLGLDGIVHKRTESGVDITPITYGTDDLTVGSALPTGQLYLVYE